MDSVVLRKIKGEYIEEEMPAGALNFNYFVVKVIAPSGKMFWVNPTDITTMLKGVSPNIADRSAVVRANL
jgi:hypothetical protein